MNFAEFKTSFPARSMFDKLGLIDYLQLVGSWVSLRAAITRFNDNVTSGRQYPFAERVNECGCSSGELVLLAAICFACDFAWLADELAHGTAWQRMQNLDPQMARCVAACIEQRD